MKNKNTKVMLAVGLLLAVASLEFSGCKKGNEDPALSLRSRKARMTGVWNVVTYGDTSTFVGISDNTSTDSEGYSYSSSSEMSYTERMNFAAGYMSQYYMEETNSSYGSAGLVNTQSGEYEYTMEDGDFEMSSMSTYTYAGGGSDIYSFDASGDHESAVSITYTFEGDGTFTAMIEMSNSLDYTYIEGGSSINSESSESSTTEISGTWSFIGGNKEDGFKKGERVALWYKSTEETYEQSATETYPLWNYTYTDSDEGDYTASGSDTDPDEVWDIVMLKNKEMKARRSYTNTYVDKSSYTYTDNDPYTENDDREYTGTSTGSSTMMLERQ